MARGLLGVPRPFADRGFPWRPPKKEEVEDIREYHVEELGMDRTTVLRHTSEEYLAVLDEFVPDDTGYRGKVAVAFPDQVDNFTIYIWEDGNVEVLADGGELGVTQP